MIMSRGNVCAWLYIKGEGGDFPLYHEGEPLFSEAVIMFSSICTHINFTQQPHSFNV